MKYLLMMSLIVGLMGCSEIATTCFSLEKSIAQEVGDTLYNKDGSVCFSPDNR